MAARNLTVPIGRPGYHLASIGDWGSRQPTWDGRGIWGGFALYCPSDWKTSPVYREMMTKALLLDSNLGRP